MLDRLQRQVERGSLFTHSVLSRNAYRVHEAESFLYGMLDVLVTKEVVTAEEVADATDHVRRRMEERGETLGPGVALRVDAPREEPDDFVAVDCAERLHVCKAICCKLHFALTADEVEAGRVRWDLGQPYFIRQEASGFCTHLDPESRGCSVYEDRPGICRRYSCAGDERIWKDFENMELNEEWLAENLDAPDLRLLAMQMLPQELVHRPVETDDAPADPQAERQP